MSGENFDAERIKEHIRRILLRVRDREIKPRDESKDTEAERKDTQGVAFIRSRLSDQI